MLVAHACAQGAGYTRGHVPNKRANFDIRGDVRTLPLHSGAHGRLRDEGKSLKPDGEHPAEVL